MASKQHIRPAVCGVALMIGAAASPTFAGGPEEPLIVTELADPDPGFVPPREPRRRAAKPHKAGPPTMNQVMEDLGRLTGQIELLGQQVRERQRSALTQACAPSADQSGSEQGCSQ